MENKEKYEAPAMEELNNDWLNIVAGASPDVEMGDTTEEEDN